MWKNKFIVTCAASVCAVLLFPTAMAFMQVGLRPFMPNRFITSPRTSAASQGGGVSGLVAVTKTQALEATFSDAQDIGFELGTKLADCTSRGARLPDEDEEVLK